MKLYYSPGACSTSCHISLEEAGLHYEVAKVDWDNPSDANLVAAMKMNALGTLPILITDDGKQLDQNLAIHEYIADQAPGKKLLPPAGSFERAQAMNWLSFVAADLHKGVGALFGVHTFSADTQVQQTVRRTLLETANKYLKYLDTSLQGKDYLMGAQFTVADAYAFIVASWTKWVEIPLTPYPNISAYLARVAARPAVAKVLKQEGLA